jgi:hypothetical protein
MQPQQVPSQAGIRPLIQFEVVPSHLGICTMCSKAGPVGMYCGKSIRRVMLDGGPEDILVPNFHAVPDDLRICPVCRELGPVGKRCVDCCLAQGIAMGQCTGCHDIGPCAKTRCTSCSNGVYIRPIAMVFIK